MARRARGGIAGGIRKDHREIKDEEPILRRNKIPDVPLEDVLPVPPPPVRPWKATPVPFPIDRFKIPPPKVKWKVTPYPFLRKDLKKVTPLIPPVTDGAGISGPETDDLEERGGGLSIYLVIGAAAIILGFLVMRRK